MASEKIEVNGVEIDSQKAQRMLQRIIVREKTNIKTKQFKHLLGAFMGIPTLMISLCFAKQLDKQCFPETRRRFV